MKILVIGLTFLALVACSGDGGSTSLDRSIGIAGIDANANGVRDDIEVYIAAQPDTNPQKSALSQMSTSLGKAMLTDTTNQGAVLAASKAIAAAAACLYARYDSSVAGKKSADMEKRTINTRARFNAYDKFNAALNGTTFGLPQGDGCAN